MTRGAEIAHVLVICLVAGILCQAVSAMAGLPSIIFLLLLGASLGPDGLGIVDPARLGPGLETLVRLGVAFILFEGSLALRMSDVKKVQKSVRLLITAGVGVTFVLATAAAHFIGGLPLRHAALFGSLVTVTGPTVIKPILRRVRVRPEVGAILEGEGILADPIGAILAAVVLQYVVSPGGTFGEHLGAFAARLAVGGVAGTGIGLAAAVIVRYHAPAMERLKPLLVLACALGCYSLSEQLLHESGIMAVVCAGLALQVGVASHDRELREFKEHITTLILSVLFIILAANLRISRIAAAGIPGALTVAALVFVIRPLNIFTFTAGDRLSFRERAWISWIGPRGIVAASVASLSAILLEKAGDPDAHRAESLVFLTIVSTVLFQGATSRPFASALGIVVTEARSVVVVGANALAMLVAEAYRDAGKRVTVIDRNFELVEAALKSGVRAICGDATDREVMEQAKLGESDVLIALTARSAVNQGAASVALHDHNIPHVWIALDQRSRPDLDPVLARAGAGIAFGRPLALDFWIVRLQNGKAGLAEIEVTATGTQKRTLKDAEIPPGVVPVFVRRGAALEMAHSGTRLQQGDKVTVLCGPDDVDKARTWLAAATMVA